MADLIERQDTIYEIRKQEVMAVSKIDRVYNQGLHNAIAVVKGMQSAQPEIIRCKECADYDTSWIPHSAPDKHYCPTMDSFMPEDGYCSYAERRADEDR